MFKSYLTSHFIVRASTTSTTLRQPRCPTFSSSCSKNLELQSFATRSCLIQQDLYLVPGKSILDSHHSRITSSYHTLVYLKPTTDYHQNLDFINKLHNHLPYRVSMFVIFLMFSFQNEAELSDDYHCLCYQQIREGGITVQTMYSLALLRGHCVGSKCSISFGHKFKEGVRPICKSDSMLVMACHIVLSAKCHTKQYSVVSMEKLSDSVSLVGRPTNLSVAETASHTHLH